MKGCQCVWVSLRGWRLRQGRPRLSTVSNLHKNRSRQAFRFNCATVDIVSGLYNLFTICWMHIYADIDFQGKLVGTGAKRVLFVHFSEFDWVSKKFRDFVKLYRTV